jgi:hypothetical protein
LEAPFAGWSEGDDAGGRGGGLFSKELAMFLQMIQYLPWAFTCVGIWPRPGIDIVTTLTFCMKECRRDKASVRGAEAFQKLDAGVHEVKLSIERQ